MKTGKWIKYATAAMMACLVSGGATLSRAEVAGGPQNVIEKVDVATLPGDKVNVRVQLQKPLMNPPAGFALNAPPRIALDFPDTTHTVAKSAMEIGQGVLRSLQLAQAKGRTRLVLNLSKPASYVTSVSGNEVAIVLESSDVQASSSATKVTRFAEARAGEKPHALRNVDFMRGKNGEGRIIVDLSDNTTGIDIRQQGKNIVVEFGNTDVPERLERRLNVTNFNTPVLHIDTMKQGKNARIVIEPKGQWEQTAYQTDNRFILDVKPILEDPNKLVQGSKNGYSGEKLSLNFQNIEVRSVLQVIADFTGFNIITSDTVSGNLTLRLKDVPWDQALDIIMQSKGLSMRKTGNVIWVAPAEELAAKEKMRLEATQQIEELEPMYTQVFKLKYHKADAFKNILTDSKQKILSKRGSAVVDARTNSLFVQDTAKHLEEVQRIINQVDIPVKQVMIESRLVIADERFGRTLGSRFGIQKQVPSSFATSGSLGNTITRRSITDTTLTETISNRVGSGTLASSQLGGTVVTPGVSPDGDQDLNVNLPVAGAFGSLAFSVFRLPAGFMLNLELSALENDKRGKVISSPRVTTANQQKAVIEQGTQIPYQQSTSSGATSVSFKDATLSLAVTPQVTPDEKIIMDLEVKKDRVGQIFAGIPSIETQRVQTQVLVSNGETAVLGGIYEQTERNDVEKVPFLGDIPIIGNAFKRTTKQNDKTELLIFITPKIQDESLAVR